MPAASSPTSSAASRRWDRPEISNPIRLLAVVALLGVTAAGAAAAAFDEPPAGLIPTSTTLAQVRTLYERTHRRERTRTAMIIEEWRLLLDKLTGTFAVRRLARDVRMTTVLGPLSYEQGVHGGTYWQMDRNGLTFTYSGFHEARDAASERAWTNDADTQDVRLIGESVALNAYVVEIAPPAGRHEWYFVDKRTGNLLRSEASERHRRYVTTYDDYRTFDGVPEPSRIHVVDSFGNEREQVLQSRTLDLSPDAKELEIPPSRRTLVEFPLATPLVRLPVRVVNGLLVAHVSIGTHAYEFLLDSGAAGVVIDPSVVEENKLERYGTRVGATIGTFSETTSIIPSLHLGTLRMRSLVTRVVTIPFRIDDRTRISGLIGFDFFDDAVVHVDLEHGIVEAIAPATFHPPTDTVSVLLALDDKTPAVRAKAGNAFGRVVLDTGANRSVFTTAFAAHADFGADPGAGVSRFRGMGGTATAEPAHIKQFELGGLAIGDPVVDVSSADLGAEDVDGTVGTDILHAYDLFFDYHAGMLYCRRAKRTAA